jgi:hypothetical protein
MYQWSLLIKGIEFSPVLVSKGLQWRLVNGTMRQTRRQKDLYPLDLLKTVSKETSFLPALVL